MFLLIFVRSILNVENMCIWNLKKKICDYFDKSPAEISKVLSLLSSRYPEYGAFRALDLDEILVFRVVPKVISVLDYTKGFGHTDLVTI